MKILLFGYGSIGQRHARNLRALRSDVQLVIADPLLTNSAPAFEPGDGWTQSYADWQQALAEHRDADGAIIASPTPAHADQLVRLLGAGIPVYCEKPLVAAADLPSAPASAGTAARTVARWDWDSLSTSAAKRSAVGFQYAFHAAMPAVGQWARESGRLSFRGQDDLLTRYGPDVEGVMVAHPVAAALRLLGPAADVCLLSDGVCLAGHIVHAGGGVSRYAFRMDRGPRESWAGDGKRELPLAPDDVMYRLCLNAWLLLLETGMRHARLATLADGLAVSRVLAEVRRFEAA